MGPGDVSTPDGRPPHPAASLGLSLICGRPRPNPVDRSWHAGAPIEGKTARKKMAGERWGEGSRTDTRDAERNPAPKLFPSVTDTAVCLLFPISYPTSSTSGLSGGWQCPMSERFEHDEQRTRILGGSLAEEAPFRAEPKLARAPRSGPISPHLATPAHRQRPDVRRAPAQGPQTHAVPANSKPGGFVALSRWLSEARATPPGSCRQTVRIPEGCQPPKPEASQPLAGG